MRFIISYAVKSGKLLLSSIVLELHSGMPGNSLLVEKLELRARQRPKKNATNRTRIFWHGLLFGYPFVPKEQHFLSIF